MVRQPRCWLCTRDRRRSHTGDPPFSYKIRPEDANKSLHSAYRIDPTRDSDQDSCLAPYYPPGVYDMNTSPIIFSTVIDPSKQLENTVILIGQKPGQKKCRVWSTVDPTLKSSISTGISSAGSCCLAIPAPFGLGKNGRGDGSTKRRHFMHYCAISEEQGWS